MVPRSIVVPAPGQKDVAGIRKWAGLDEACLAIVLDAKPEELVGISRADHVVPAPAFNRPAEDAFNRPAEDAFNRPAADACLLDSSPMPADQDMVENMLAALHTLPTIGVSQSFIKAFVSSLCSAVDIAKFVLCCGPVVLLALPVSSQFVLCCGPCDCYHH